MAESTIWWALAGTLVAIELLTGVFYLLMLAIGLSAAAVAAHLGADVTIQLVTFAVVGSAFVTLWHMRKQSQPGEAPAQSNGNVNMDIGAIVEITSWRTDGSADIQYRGARWSVVHHDFTLSGAQITSNALPPAPGNYRITQVIGSQFVVANK